MSHSDVATRTRVANPYLESFQAAQQRLAVLAAGCDEWDLDFVQAQMSERDHHTHTFAWAVPNQAAISAILDEGPVVEVGAGLGYWAHLLDAAGGDVVAYDTAPDPDRNHFTRGAPWFPVMAGDADVSRFYPDRALLLVWPPYDEAMAAESLVAYAGDTVIYVGEPRDGCTADDLFFDLLDEFFELVRFVDIPRWDGMRDGLTIWKRR